jgi:hypothetical protein
VKQKPVAAILARAIAVGLCFFDSASAQSSEEKPEKAFWLREVKISEDIKLELQASEEKPEKVFWPREVKISEEVKVEQKTKYGVVSAKRIAGSVVKVISLESDSLRIESGGLLGAVNVEKTDFWHRAEKTRDAAIERQKREQAANERERPATEPRPRPKTAEIYNPQIFIGMTRLRCVRLRMPTGRSRSASRWSTSGFTIKGGRLLSFIVIVRRSSFITIEDSQIGPGGLELGVLGLEFILETAASQGPPLRIQGGRAQKDASA